jgi:hypothetical protein
LKTVSGLQVRFHARLVERVHFVNGKTWENTRCLVAASMLVHPSDILGPTLIYACWNTCVAMSKQLFE